MLLNLLWHPEENRPRALLRIGLYFALVGLIGAVVLLAYNALAYRVVLGIAPPDFATVQTTPAAPLAQAGRQVVLLLVTGAAVWVARTRIDERPLEGVGLGEGLLPDLGVGLALGAALFGLAFGALRAGGWLPPLNLSLQNPTLPLVVVTLAAGAAVIGVERTGYLLTNLREGFDSLGPWWAAIVSGVVLAAISETGVGLLVGLAAPFFPRIEAVGELTVLSATLTLINVLLLHTLLVGSVLLRENIGLATGFTFWWLMMLTLFNAPTVPVADPTPGTPLVMGGASGFAGGLAALIVVLLGLGGVLVYGRLIAPSET